MVFDVAVQPFAAVTRTEYTPDVVAETACVVSLFDHK